MIESWQGFKPVFLLDNQKTITAHKIPEQNKLHQQPSDFDQRDYLITKRMLDIFCYEYEKFENGFFNGRFEGIMSQISWLGMALSRDINPNDLIITPERSWQMVRSDLLHKDLIKSDNFSQPDQISDWYVTDEARRLMTRIRYELGCHQLVVSGVLSGQRKSMDQSFREQEVIDLLTEPKYLLRVPSVRSTHLHKAFVHSAMVNLGFATIAIDDDPNTIETIQKFTGCPAVLVSTPQEMGQYTKIKGADLIEDPKSGPLFQRGIDGNDLFELAYRAYRQWI